jgi:transposase
VPFAGWDWASTSHAVTVVDAAGSVVDGWTCAHTEPDLDATLSRLASHAPPAALPVAIEATNGLVVDRLLAAGHPVIPVHATAFHAARPRWSAAGAKSDPGDSYKLADYLRTDHHRLRRLEPVDAATRELQALVRLRADHVAAKTAASNQLWALLGAHWPGARTLWFRLASPIALDFLAAYPTPQAAAGLTEADLATFCRRHAYRGGKTASELLRRLRTAPTPPRGLDPAVLSRLVTAQVALLRTILAGIAELERAIKHHLAEHPKARLLATLPYAGQVSLAQLLAELGPILDRASSADQAAAEAGAVPVTRASARPPRSASAWPPTATPAKPYTSSPTTPATAHPGRPSSTPTPAPAASATPRPSASSAAPGSGSSGPAGTPTPPTTPPSTAPNSASLPHDLTQDSLFHKPRWWLAVRCP